MMKKFVKIITVTALAFLLFSNSVGAVSLAQNNIEIPIDGDYEYITNDNIEDEQEFVESLGFTVKTMKDYFKTNNYILLAKNGAHQIQVRSNSTGFSKEIGEMSLLPENSISDIAPTILGNVDYEVFSTDNMLFFKTVTFLSDSGGEYYDIQYVTIAGGFLLTIDFFDNGTTTDLSYVEFAENTVTAVKPIKADKADASRAHNLTEVVIVGILILSSFVLFVAMVISLFSDIKNRKDGTPSELVITRRKIGRK